MKTKEWLISHLEEGDTLEAAVLLELLDSYIHKSEFGNVSPGDERVVSGDAVNSAITAACARVVQTVRGMVADILAEMLPSILANYVTSSGLAAALADMATKTWVNDQISGLATNSAVEEAISQHDDSMRTEIGTRLQPYVLADRLSSLIDFTPYARTEQLGTLLSERGYKTKTELDLLYPLIDGLGTRLAQMGYKTRVELGTDFILKENHYTKAQLDTIVDNMNTKVAAAASSAQSASSSAAAAASVPNSNLIDRVLAMELKVDGDPNNNVRGLLARATDLETKVDGGTGTTGLLTRATQLETTVGDATRGLVKDNSDIKTEIGSVGVNESLTKDLDLTRKHINMIMEIWKDDKADPYTEMKKLADLIVKENQQ